MTEKKKFDLGKLLKQRGLVRDKEDPQSLARVQRAVGAIEDALDKIEGLTPSERSQALTMLAGYQGLKNVISSAFPSPREEQ